MVELDDADGAAHAHVGHPGQPARGREPRAQPGLDRPDLGAPPALLQEPDRRDRDGGSERVAHERRPVHEHAWPTGSAGSVDSAVGDPAGDRRGAQRGGHRQVPAGQRLADAHDVGRDARVLGGEERTRPAEPGGDLVEHQQHVVGEAQLAQHVQVAGVVEAHAACALDDRLDDHRGQLVGVRLDQPRQLRDVVLLERGRGRSGEHLPRQHVAPQRVHAAVRVADAHRAEGVAVVAAAPGHQPMLGRVSARPLVLQTHLDRDLDRDRAGVAEEDVLEPGGGDVDEQPGQLDGRTVREAAEHHVAHRAELVAHRGVEHGMAVAVDRRPPRRHPVDQLAPVRQPQPHPLRRHDRQRRHGGGHRRVGVPDMRAVGGQQVVDALHAGEPRAGRGAPRPGAGSRRAAPPVRRRRCAARAGRSPPARGPRRRRTAAGHLPRTRARRRRARR